MLITPHQPHQTRGLQGPVQCPTKLVAYKDLSGSERGIGSMGTHGRSPPNSWPTRTSSLVHSDVSSLSDSDFEPESDDALEYDSSDDDESAEEEDDAVERELQDGKASLQNCPHVLELYTEHSDGLKAVGGSPGERQFLERLSATCGWIAQFELVGTRHPCMVEVLVAYFDRLDAEEDLEVMPYALLKLTERIFPQKPWHPY